MKLFCAFLGEDEDAFPVQVDASDTIADLKKAILQEADTGVDVREAYKVHLFIKADGAWLPSEEAKHLLNSATLTKLSPSKLLSKVLAGELGEDVIHVFVKLPDVAAREAVRLLSISRTRVALKEIESRRVEEEREARKEERLSRVPEKRKRLWKDLNAALASKRHKGDSTPFSSFDWENLPKSYKPRLVTSGAFHELLESADPIDEDTLDAMTSNVEMKMWAYDAPSKTNEATRVQFMSTAFEYVVSMFKTDPVRVTLSVQAKLVGDAQDILGMEVAVEENEQEIIYGIVTNYTVWHFLKRSDDGIERKEDCINPSLNVPDELKRVASKIYAMLA